MNVLELIGQLEKMPLDAKVSYFWDGEPRSEVELVYLSKEDGVVLSSEEEYDEPEIK